MHGEYSPRQIESKWQAHWEAHSTFKMPNPGEAGFDSDKPKFYVLDMFPYPSGAGLHVGHPEGYTATDIVARYRRMCGYNVLHPMGWDAFGLPAEQHAVETGQHPAVTTKRNIDTFRRQLKMLGFSYDWDREIATTDPAYYRWTQWIFLQLFNSWFDEAAQKARPISELEIPAEVQAEGDAAVRRFVESQRLAYLAEVPVNWCPALGTVLSNEEVTNDGRSDRGNHPVFRRPMRQWMLRITKYADRLANDLEALDWPESVKLMQRNWVGRSEGAQVRFKVDGFDEEIEVFTTRPDTLFGATYMVLAPEHPLVERITTAAQREAVTTYCTQASRRSELDRTADTKEKTGVATGAFAVNPVNDEKIPIWVADYVLMTYGTGAIMAVPGSDARDYDFALAFDLPIVQVVSPSSMKDAAQGMYTPANEIAIFGESKDASGRTYIKIGPGCFVGEGIAVNSPSLPSRQSCGTGVPPVNAVTEDDRVSWRNLPHIQRGGSSYFVTFRVKDGALSPEERTIVLDACNHWHGIKATISAVVVMPDHVHLLLTPHERSEGQWISLGEIMHSIKSFTAHEITKLRKTSGPIWLDEYFDRVIRNESEYVEKWEYIEANPVTADIAPSPDEYEWLTLRQISLQEEEYRRDAGATDSGFSDVCDINGLPTKEAKEKITAWLAERGLGRATVNYKLRDWLFSRQRYWGEPFPILHGPDGEIVALDESELPLMLPDVDDYRPVSQTEVSEALPEPPLGRATAWVEVQRDGKTYRRELNTMPQWAGSCWYYLRFCDPKNDERLCSEQAEQYWMVSKKKDGTPHAGGIDLYLGGAEHAVLHLLYARFWHKVLFDLGHVSTPEPFGKLFNQGMIRAFAYKDGRGSYVGYEEIDFREDGAYRKADGEKLSGAVEKMSKSLKNVINPDEVIGEHGADALRLYEMFMGPLDASKPWNPRDVPGVFRFLQRVWRLIAGEGEGLSPMVVDDETEASQNEKTRASRAVPGPGADLERTLHATIKKVGTDIERMAFNTAISAMMSFVNEAYRAGKIHRDQAERFVLLLSPFAPHISEELWQRLRGKAWNGSMTYEPWPTHDDSLLVEDEVEIPVQVNGKLAGRITVAKDADEQTVRDTAQANEKVAARLGGATVIKTIYVPGRMLNLIVRNER